MFLSIWNYLRGYVTIEVYGFSVERFMNLASYKGIYLWDIKRNNSKVQMKVSIKGFRMLKTCAKKTKCKIKIIQKKGWPFVAHRYRKRKMMALGGLIFLGILYLLSSFIWVIEINGNEKISTEELIKALEEYGLKPGTWKRNIDTNQVENFLITNFNDIAWTAVDIKGTKAIIDLTETVTKPEIVDKDTPCDLVAEKTGLIISMVIRAGTPKVEVKDLVQKGDILVSGELVVNSEDEIQEKKYVHADADILAKTRYELTYEQPLLYMEKQYTGKVKKQYGIEVINKEFNFFKPRISFQNYDKIINKTQLSLTKYLILPIQGVIYEYKEYKPIIKKKTLEEAKKIAEQEIKKELEEKIGEDGEIVTLDIKYYTEENFLKAKAVSTVIEPIDKPQLINRRKTIDATEGKDTTDTN
ncbi:sporulation protein YqfD [Defluviitalea phaphyphila]|uniref:sporulation protein YqfD n=1 Tax=Defluviitalea phaphyphila TaxID=1473580 RepID=UPI000731155E|nr:sporulation protein YqfD [Defluviitalea phaphyphila]